jgi:hypothetical protein
LHDVRPFWSKGWTVAASYSYVVPLDLEAAWGKVEQNLRRLIDRARNAGMTLCDGDDAFDDFFRLHAATLDRHGAGVYLPRDAFRRVLHDLRRNGWAGTTRFAPKWRASRRAARLARAAFRSHTACAGADPESTNRERPRFLRWAPSGLARSATRGTTSDAALNPVRISKSAGGAQLSMVQVGALAAVWSNGPTSGRARRGGPARW